MILPPKRFEDPSHPVYDPIRHHPWFQKLIKRRKKIPFLKQALARWDETEHQRLSAVEFGIDERELRSYRLFVKKNRIIRDSQVEIVTHMLDSAYATYCSNKGHRSYVWCLKKVAALYGKTPKQLVEIWEADATMYPSTYRL